MHLDLTPDEATSLTQFLRQSIQADRFPMAPRLQPLKAILAKLDPKPRQERRPPPKLPGERSLALSRKRRR